MRTTLADVRLPTDDRREMKDRTHGLFPLLVTQFLGAFEDNAWKLIVTGIAVAAATAGLDETEHEVAATAATSLVFLVFLVPMVLVSLPGGALADRFSKGTVVLGTKALELAVMVVATVTLWLAPEADGVLIGLVGVMGLQSGLFGPSKYGILPELVPHSRLSWANGWLEMSTFIAIVLGTAAGPWMLDQAQAQLWIAPGALAVMSLVGLAAAWGIPRVAPVEGRAHSFGRGVVSAWRTIRRRRGLWLAVIGSAWFWAIASLLAPVVVTYSTTRLGLDEAVSGLPLAVFGIGVGVGSVLAGKLSRGKVEVGLAPMGALGLGLGTLVFGLWLPGEVGTYVLLGFLGVSSGLLVVPLNSLIQWLAPADRRGSVIALSNVLVGIGMIVGNLAGLSLAQFLGLDLQAILLISAAITLLGTLWAIYVVPHALLRLVLVLLTHTVYRLKVLGRDNLPETGGVLLTPNHVSLVDGLFLIASTDRPVRFLIDAGWFSTPGIRWVFQALGAIPIAAEGGPRQMMRALKDAGEYLDQGEVVCIFPEGQLTRTGQLLPFRRGLSRIAKGRNAVIVPTHLDRVWGSIFSREGGKFIWKLPRRIPYAVTVSYGEPVPTDTPIHEIRKRVQALDTEAWFQRRADFVPLHRKAISSLRRSPWKLCFADGRTPKLSRFAALTGAIALARALRPHWEGQRHVGLLMPPSVPGALLNLAAALAGRTSVNLNYTAGADGMGSAARQAKLRTVVTSKIFLQKGGFDLPEGVEPIWLEELAPTIGKGSKLCAALYTLFAPAAMIERACGTERVAEPDDVLTIIFSSGSTGEPKGVLLSHFNVDCNVEAVSQAFGIREDDSLLGILPLFHSFGCLLLWVSVNRGLATAFHPNPMDAPVIGHLVSKYRLSLLLATPTFLQIYLRRCTPEQFSSLRAVLAGAEKLSERLRDAFEEAFGIRPLEGYGTTECAPAVALSAPAFRAPGFFQPGSKKGFVGHPLPGVSVRIVDPDTGDECAPGEAGMLLVRGPNVMLGYLGREDLTSKVLQEGWYETGDIAKVDADGYLAITDRLSRFSKIGGEMVPHGKIEEVLHELVEAGGEQLFGVTALPDERKGEKLVVLHTLDAERVAQVHPQLAERGLPNLFIPRKDLFFAVEELPVLGTGKLDLKGLKRIAAELVGE